jgi:outer membrane lipoprotein carrier protein
MKLKIYSTLFLMGITHLLFASTPTSDLVAIFNHVTSIQGSFTQTVYDKQNTALSTSQGTYIIERPDKFRWDTKTPMEQLSVGNGQQVWTYQPDLEQVTINPMSKQVGQTPLAILSGSVGALKNYFTITEIDSHTFLLAANDPNAPFSKITLIFKQEMINKMILMDDLGQKTTLVFSDVKNNVAFPASTFNFSPPAGTDIITNQGA